MRAPRCTPHVVSVLIALLGAKVSTAQQQETDSLLDAASYRSLAAEIKAFRIGDVLTVIVQEAASASSTADLRGERNFSVGAQLDSTMGGEHLARAGTDTASDGAGRTQRSGRLLAQLSVTVTGVTPTGDLKVSGAQRLKINGEEQLIALQGVVRPRDVAADNTVPSSRVAHAQIEFDGEGFVTEQSRPGWLARFFSLLGF